jgi:hypothetical protein
VVRDILCKLGFHDWWEAPLEDFDYNDDDHMVVARRYLYCSNCEKSKHISIKTIYYKEKRKLEIADIIKIHHD